MAIAAQSCHFDYRTKCAALDEWPTAVSTIAPASESIYANTTRFDTFSSLSLDDNYGEFDYGLFAPIPSSSFVELSDHSIPSITGNNNTSIRIDSTSSSICDAQLDNFFVKIESSNETERSDETSSLVEAGRTDVCRELILRHLVQDVGATCSKLNLTMNPLLWTAADCAKWIMEMCDQFQLPAPAPAAFYFCVKNGGGALFAMRADQLHACLGADIGDMLHTQTQLWRTAFKSMNSANINKFVSDTCETSNDINAWNRRCDATPSSSVYADNIPFHDTPKSVCEDWSLPAASNPFPFKVSPKEFELSSSSSCVSAEPEPTDDEFPDEFQNGPFTPTFDLSQQQQLQQRFLADQRFNEQHHEQQQFFYNETCHDKFSDVQSFSDFHTTRNHVLHDDEITSNLSNSFIEKSDEPHRESIAVSTMSAVHFGPTASPAVGAFTAATSGTVHLWHFIRELLDQPLEYSSCVRWVNRNEGTFKIESSHKLAHIWGQRKNRSQMNYDKLSRSLRQYYKKGIIQKPEKKQRLVYKFLPPYNL